jgi:hypothetical protein
MVPRCCQLFGLGRNCKRDRKNRCVWNLPRRVPLLPIFAPPASFFIEGFAVAVDPCKLMREEWGETVIRDSNPLPGVNATSYKPAAPAGR